MKLETNDLRAIAGLILLCLSLVSLITQNETESVKFILLAMAGFLVGGQLLGYKQTNKTDE